MTDGKDDELDPSDWLASQFGEDPPAPPPSEPTPPAIVVSPEVNPSNPTSPVIPPSFQVAPPEPPEKSSPAGAPFQWGLTPGAEVPPLPELPDAAPPAVVPPPVLPPPVMPAPAAAPPVLPQPPIIPQPVIPNYQPPTAPEDVATQAMPITPGMDVEKAPWEPWQARPLDDHLDGATEVIEAELVGLDGPEGESNPTPSIDDIFGDGQFREYEDGGVIPPLPPTGAKPPQAPRIPMSKTQKTLLWVAGGMVALLALVALFLLGTRLAATVGPSPALTPSASPSPSPAATLVVLPPGPIAPGEHRWDALLGGECLSPFESAWQENYTVVDCATPHPAQMVFRGLFADPAGTVYPGVDDLQSRINLLCTAPTVINYQIAGTAQDIQVSASFPVDEADWDAGNRSYFCFVNRASGENLTASVALPQPAITLAPPVAP